jgi:hypothetical protein
MSDRTFRLIFDGKKGGLVKGSSPSSAAKKACKKLSAEQMKNSTVFHQLSLKDKVLKTEPGKTSFKFELQETTKDSKKKVYGPYKIKVKMAGGANPFLVLSNNSKPKNTSFPPFVVNNSNEIPNHVNLSYNFSGVSKNDLVKQLKKLIKISQKIKKLHDEFSKELSNKKRSVINSLSELPKNTKPLSNINTLPPKLTKINKSNINFGNYNLQESLARGDIEQKFYELSNFYRKINTLIQSIQAQANLE